MADYSLLTYNLLSSLNLGFTCSVKYNSQLRYTELNEVFEYICIDKESYYNIAMYLLLYNNYLIIIKHDLNTDITNIDFLNTNKECKYMNSIVIKRE